jgi:hypothetical protein
VPDIAVSARGRACCKRHHETVKTSRDRLHDSASSRSIGSFPAFRRRIHVSALPRNEADAGFLWQSAVERSFGRRISSR